MATTIKGLTGKARLARAFDDEMLRREVSKTEMARRMGTSRAALDRLLDPANDSVTLQTLLRAAAALGMELEVALRRDRRWPTGSRGFEATAGNAEGAFEGGTKMTNFADWQAICETKARYCRCLDTKDWAGYTDCFTEDYRLDTPPAGNIHEGRDAAVRYVRSCVETSITNHHVHNPEIAFDGPDAADVIWAMQDRNIWSEDRREQIGCSGHTGFGHYHERYVRCADGKWRIKAQRLSYVHMDLYDVVGRTK